MIVATAVVATAPPAMTAAAATTPSTVDRCDVDGDGFGDLVTGAAREGSGKTGAVYIYFGSAAGLTDRVQRVVSNPSASDSWFGTVLACGDFDADGHDDIAAGLWAARVGGASAAGEVQVFYGGDSGVDAARTQELREGAQLSGKAQRIDFLGATLAVGDFDGDGTDDLGVGAPNDHVKISDDCCGTVGSVYEIHGVAGRGLDAAHASVWSQDTPGVPGKVQRLDDFGDSLAAGDFDGDGRDDLAIGSPQEATGGHRFAGEVIVLPGSAKGLTGDGAVKWSQESPGIPGSSGKNDQFGGALAAGDLGRGPQADLVISVQDSGGQVDVLYGGPDGLGADVDTLSQSTPGVPGGAAKGDVFGSSLAIGDLDGDGHRDLAVVTKKEDNGANAVQGALTVLPGTTRGVTGEGAERLVASDLPVPTTRPNALFGWGLGVTDVGAARPLLIVSAPKADPASSGTTLNNAGVVVLIPGGADSPSAAKAERLAHDPAAGAWFGSGLSPTHRKN